MKTKQIHKLLLAGLMVLTLLFGLLNNLFGSVSAAESSGEIKNQLGELEAQKKAVAQQIEELQNQLSENAVEMNEMVDQKDLIDREIALLHQQIATINEQISAYSLLIADKQEELEEAQAHFAQIQEQNKERIRAMEKNGKLSYWSILFKAHSFIDLLDRLRMIEQIADADRERLEQIRAAAKAVTDAKNTLKSEMAGLEAVREELGDTQLGLEEKRLQADTLLNQLLAEGEEFEALLELSEQSQSDLMVEIAQKEAQYEEAKYQEWLETSVPPTTAPPETQPPETTQPSTAPEETTDPATPAETTEPTTEPEETTEPITEPENTIPPATGESIPEEPDENANGNGTDWLVPIQYTMVSSPFGYRYHPITGDWRMHYGVDLAAPTGTPIYASRSGVVTTTDYQEGGAGNYVSINHGDGYASIYMHMTHYIVSAGEQVTAGQVIGYCGSTGGSNGPHLHFGISYRGTYVNPADYIPI